MADQTEVAIATPPPPPPPLPPSLAGSSPMNLHSMHHRPCDKTQLLADICKGTTLKKVTVNDTTAINNHHLLDSNGYASTPRMSKYEVQMKSSQDLLQAELCNTLKRRKPVAIVDPPKYQYPVFDDNNKGESSSSSASSACDHNSKNMTHNQIETNVSNTLAVVSTIKTSESNSLSNAVASSITSKSPQSRGTDKPMISHAKPNFALPRKDQADKTEKALAKPLHQNAKGNKNQTGECKVVTFSEPNKSMNTIKTNAIIVKVNDGVSVQQTPPPPLPVKVTTGKEKVLVKRETTETDQKKLLISHGKPNFVVTGGKNLQSEPSPKNTLNSKKACENYLEVKIKSLKPQKSVDDSMATTNVANKKAIFERTKSTPTNNERKMSSHNPLQSAIKTLKSPAKLSIINSKAHFASPRSANSTEIHQALSQLRSAKNKNEKVIPMSKSPNHSGQSSPGSDLSADSGHSSPLPRMPIPSNKNTFEHAAEYVNEMSTNLAPAINSEIEATGNNNNHTTSYGSSTNFEQKTVVSFSKELVDSPNRYPEQVCVTKMVSTSSESIVQQTVFKNIRFSIDQNGQVMQKLK